MLDIACLAIDKSNAADQLRNAIFEAQPKTTAWNAYYKALEAYLKKLEGSYTEKHLNLAKGELLALNKAADTSYRIMFMTGKNKSGISVEVGEQKTQSTAVKDVLKKNIFTPTHPAYNGSNLYHCDHTEPMYVVHNIIRKRPIGNFFFTQMDMCNNCYQLVLKKVENPTVVISAFRSKVPEDSDCTGSGVNFMYDGKITPNDLSTHIKYDNLCRIEISPQVKMAPEFSITFNNEIVKNIVAKSVNSTKITTTTYKSGDNEVMETTKNGDKLLTEKKYDAKTGNSIKETTYLYDSTGITGKKEIVFCGNKTLNETLFKFVEKDQDQTSPYDNENFIQETSTNKINGEIKQKIEYTVYNDAIKQFTKKTEYFSYDKWNKSQESKEYMLDVGKNSWEEIKSQPQPIPLPDTVSSGHTNPSVKKGKENKSQPLNCISTQGNLNRPNGNDNKKNGNGSKKKQKQPPRK